MNAILKAKREKARAWLLDREVSDDWRQKRAFEARDWLLEHGMPHSADPYWGYTSPSLLEAKTGDKPGVSYQFDGTELIPTTNVDEAGLVIRPIADAENSLYGTLVERAQKRADRPMAETVLLGGEGLFIDLKFGSAVLCLNRDDWPMSYYLGIFVAKDAKLTIIETGSQPKQLTGVIEADIAPNAELNYIRIAQGQAEVLHGHLFARLEKESELRSFTLSGANTLNRFESIVDLEGTGANVSISGADLLLRSGHQDDTIFITHHAENCRSRQVFKRVVGAGATSVFQGKILVEPGAQKTDGYQVSRVLMLDERGEALTKPELEIYADDVACSHGSTSSGLDETALFYLRSRGIPLEEARKLLIRAFIDEALDEVAAVELREVLQKISESWIFET